MSSTLVLNADGSPVSMLPLSTIPWHEAIKYMVLDKATVLEWHDSWIVNSRNWSTPVPAVIILKEMMKKKHIVRYSKQNVFLRDGYVCQYCAASVTHNSATLDHVVPISHGGKSTFENSTTACGPCNSRKGNDARIKPKVAPIRPNYYYLVEQRKKLPFKHSHPSWELYLGINQ